MIIKQLKQQPLHKIDLFNKLATSTYFKNNDRPTAEERVDLVAYWQDLKIKEVEQMSMTTINSIVNGVLEIVRTYEAQAPRERISYLSHRTDYSQFSAGHHKHIENVDYEKSPESFMALFYIEEGLQYGHEKKEGGRTIIVNPLEDRAKVIKKESNLSELIDLLTFFLNISHLLTSNWVSKLHQMIREKRKEATP